MNKWLNKYIAYLGLEKEEPTKDFLIKLYQHHLARVPYELTSKFIYSLGGTYIPTIEVFVENLIHRGFGGNCYILNINFLRLLHTLGFQGYLVNVEPGHLGIIISIEERDYFVDVGYGAPLNQLVELKQENWNGKIFGEEIFFTYKDDNQIEYERVYKGKMIVSKKIHLSPMKEIDFQTNIEASFHDSDANPFMRRVSMAKVTGTKYIWVRNNRITVRHSKEDRTTKFNNIEDWMDRIHKEFQLGKDDLKWTVDFLQQRGVSLGFKNRVRK